MDPSTLAACGLAGAVAAVAAAAWELPLQAMWAAYIEAAHLPPATALSTHAGAAAGTAPRASAALRLALIDKVRRQLALVGMLRTVGAATAVACAAQLAAPLGLGATFGAALLALAAIGQASWPWRMAAKRRPRPEAWVASKAALWLGRLSAPLTLPLARLQASLGAWLNLPEAARTPMWLPGEASTGSHSAEGPDGRGGDLWRSLHEFKDTVIREIMVPRTQMIALDRAASAEQLRAELLRAGHSRLPVYDDTIDHVVGLLHVKDLMFSQWAAAEQSTTTIEAWQALVRPTFYVPEVMKIGDLLREFQRRKTHMAIVVDEYGGTSGVVTLEDIIEEIVGEIHDEYDVEEKQFRRAGDKILADGRVSIYDLEGALGLRLRGDGSFETLAGFLTAQLGSLPRRGLSVRFGPWTFLIKEATDKRVEVVEIAPAGP